MSQQAWTSRFLRSPAFLVGARAVRLGFQTPRHFLGLKGQFQSGSHIATLVKRRLPSLKGMGGPIQVVKTKGQVGSDGRLRLEVPVELPAGIVEPVLIVGESPEPNGSKYDSAGVVRRLEWQGDAVEQQRKLRDEWCSVSVGHPRHR